MVKHRPDPNAMTFWEHLGEFRTRVIRAFAAFIGASLLAFGWAEQGYAWLVQPLIRALPPHQGVYFLSPVEPFLVYLKISLLMGIILASPYVLYQIWAFVQPALKPEEKKFLIPFLSMGTIFLIIGVLFCRYLVLPLGMKALLDFAYQTTQFDVSPQITMAAYFDVSIRLLLAFGIVFEMPILALFGSILGLFDYKVLMRQWRYATVAAFLLGALLTPPDVATQLLLALPMILLYGLSIGLAYLLGKKRGES